MRVSRYLIMRPHLIRLLTCLMRGEASVGKRPGRPWSRRAVGEEGRQGPVHVRLHKTCAEVLLNEAVVVIEEEKEVRAKEEEQVSLLGLLTRR